MNHAHEITIFLHTSAQSGVGIPEFADLGSCGLLQYSNVDSARECIGRGGVVGSASDS